jgi:DNA-binding HxlR family transcriptional regulator
VIAGLGWESILGVVACQEGDSISLAPAVRLFHHRYSVPIVAVLAHDRGAKFVTLLNRTGASRDTLSETLSHLIEEGVVAKNPGYGHPMRPEYVLTPFGETLGAPCIRATEVVVELGIVEVALKKWPMLVLVAMGRGGTRFGEIKDLLPGITPRALTGALRDLQAAGLADRTITENWPPHTVYQLTGLARQALPVLEEICRTCELEIEGDG